jgi:hypothetical protein
LGFEDGAEAGFRMGGRKWERGAGRFQFPEKKGWMVGEETSDA